MPAEPSERPVTDGPPPLTRWQILGALVFPILGLAGDYFITNVWISAPWIYGMCWLVGAAAFLISARAKPGSRMQDMTVGAMAACALGAAIVGTGLLPSTMVLLLLMGVGLLGFVPFGVVAALASRVVSLWQSWRALPFAALGTAIFCVPLLIQTYEWSWVDRELTALKSEDPAVVERALRALNDYPLNFGRFAIPACWSLVIYAKIDYRPNPGLAHEVERMLGRNPADCDTGDPHS